VPRPSVKHEVLERPRPPLHRDVLSKLSGSTSAEAEGEASEGAVREHGALEVIPLLCSPF
jgi:hypothetical protein